MTTTSQRRRRAARARDGMTLIEVVVACSLLAITLTGLTAVAVRMAERSRSNAILDQRTAVFLQEINRVEAMPYDSLTSGNYLKSDSVRSGPGYYVWTYTVSAPVVSMTTGVLAYRNVTVTVTPRQAPTKALSGTVRRSRSPFSAPLNVGS
jgi:prepilin-type N-terminal cleavage/methylation domain-containing protein